jgi:hypothetical protein
LSTPDSGSIHAMLPPPAPIEVTSMTGTATGYFANTGASAYPGSPSTMVPTSKLVPPTSVAITGSTPRRRASARAPSIPPAGPDESSVTPRSRASSSDETPPAECITDTAPRCPAARRRSPMRLR